MSHVTSRLGIRGNCQRLSIKRTIFPCLDIVRISMLHGIVIHVAAFFEVVFFVAYRMFKIPLLPDRIVALHCAAVALEYMACVLRVAVLGKVSLYTADDFWVCLGFGDGDDHMKVIREYDNVIE